MLYPLKLKPVYKEYIWGGKRLREKFGKDIPSDCTAESWEVACHKNGTSIVSNGYLKGKALSDVIKDYGIELVGKRVGQEGIEKFPLLVKILDAYQTLSVQVHPDDEYARINENGELGKTEMWYVIDAEPNSNLIYGVKPGTTKEQLKNSIEAGNLEEHLNKIDVNKGDVFFIPAGTLHAICEGLLIAEIQQNSDTTYRVYDWNRVDSEGKSRPLHVDKALDTIDFTDVSGNEKVKGLTVNEGENIRTYFVACKYFATERIIVNGKSHENTGGDKFDLIIVIEGEGKIAYSNGEEAFVAGDSFVLPACLEDYVIEGNCTVIKSYVPDIEKDTF